MSDRAILFGINNYKSISSLRGCENDLLDVRQLLIDDFGFSPNNIHVYKNEQVVKKTVEAEFRWLAKDSRAGDRLVFHFSGHGSYTTSKSPDKDIDELLCLYDMDWKKESSFLRDTDLGQLTRSITSGARLTVLLDSCHSGDGTRAFSSNLRALKRTSSTSSLVIKSDTARRMSQQNSHDDIDHHIRGIERADRNTLTALSDDESLAVFARFVAPPASVQTSVTRRATTRVRALGESLQADLNHQLLAAAHEKQTAADAYIDGQFRGAFSFFLCATARANPRSSFAEVMRMTTEKIKEQGFSQDPQIKGPFAQETLFGYTKTVGTVSSDGGSGTTAEPNPGSFDSGASDTPLTGQVNPAVDNSQDLYAALAGQTATAINAGADMNHPNNDRSKHSASDPLRTLDRLLRVSEKLIDLADKSRVATGATSAQATQAVTAPHARATADEVIVYVHGISEHLPGYSKQWHASLENHLQKNLRTAEVRWSQIVNDRSVEASGRRATRDATEAAALQKKIEAELEQRVDKLESSAQARNMAAPGSAREVVRMERPRSFITDDFTRYMLFKATREKILEEFFKVVKPELEAGRKVHIISHSWGTVVAYEGMRRLDDLQATGHVANLFTAGSALSIGVVQSNLIGRVKDGRTPVHVRHIVNLDAGGDVVGGPIGDRFTVDREFLGLDPVGCRKIPFTGIAFNPVCAHSSYFRSENLAVNRDIFAAYINAT